jgi:hypothetical protein
LEHFGLKTSLDVFAGTPYIAIAIATSITKGTQPRMNFIPTSIVTVAEGNEKCKIRDFAFAILSKSQFQPGLLRLRSGQA